MRFPCSIRPDHLRGSRISVRRYITKITFEIALKKSHPFYKGQMGISKMQRTWLLASAAAAVLSASSVSFAADLANRSVYAQPAPPLLPPVYNWTGFYIGGNLGGAWANGTVTDNVTGASLSGNNAGFIGGGTMGYNWQFAPNWVVGVEGTFETRGPSSNYNHDGDHHQCDCANGHAYGDRNVS